MFNRRPKNLGELFLEEAGNKLRRSFCNAGRDQDKCLRGIRVLAAGVLPRHPEYSEDSFENLDLKEKSKRAAQILLHGHFLRVNPRAEGCVTLAWRDFRPQLHPLISSIQESYRDEAAKAVVEELQYRCSHVFYLSLQGRPDQTPAFRVPLPGKMDLNFVPGEIGQSSYGLLSVNASLVPKQKWWDRLVSPI